MPVQQIEKKRYHYFDTPDGQDVFKKWWCVMRPTIPAAIIFGTGDVVLWSYPKGRSAIIFRFAAVSLPVLGIASTFVFATNAITSLRKKDDRLNWFLGGFLTGSCFGLWKRSRVIGFNAGLGLGILAMIRKEMLIKDWELTPKRDTRIMGAATDCLADFSFTKERPKSWTTGV